MKPVRVLPGLIAVAIFLGSAAAQCNSPELVKGAYRYNELVCKASAAAQIGDNQKALDFYLSALNVPILESPNIRLFTEVAKTYAALGKFRDADLYMKYDNLAVLWMIGIIRCHQSPNSADESLFQDGKLLTSEEAKHMSDVLCGPVFDEFSYFRDRDTQSFVPAAKAILRHEEVRNELEKMRRD